jgi:hypothetical protein
MVKDGEPQVYRSNPFTPSFGVTPPKLVGRDDELIGFREALISGPGAPGRSMLFTGTRGSGKTVLLNTVESIARQRGWFVIAETARKNFASALTDTIIPRILMAEDPDVTDSRITGVNASVLGVGGGFNREISEKHLVKPNFRARLEDLVDLAERRGVGVLLSVDEVHRTPIDDMREIAQAVQHCFRASRQVAFVAAGLPSAVADILNDDVISFLRRSEQFRLGTLTEPDAAQAIAVPIHDMGKRITDSALRMAADATHGFPFLTQLIGYHSWIAADTEVVITTEHVEYGATRARRQLDTQVFEPALHDLSEKDQDFLAAMSADDGPSQLSAVAQRMGVDRNYINRYRKRLIAADMIVPSGRGRVDFTMPYLREYLRSR